MSNRRLAAPSALALSALLLLNPQAWSFSIPVHDEVTRVALQSYTIRIARLDLGFTPRALMEIQKANELTDDELSLSAATFMPSRHFTNENLKDGTQRLIDLKDEIVEELTSDRPDGSTARKKLGRALHTIQDFYSHSNWVELGNREINRVFGRGTLEDPPASVMPCSTDKNVLDAGGGGVLTTAYFRGISGCVIPMPAGKCFHGNYNAFGPISALNCLGINKDLSAADAAEKDPEGKEVRSSRFHAAAVNVATDASLEYLEQIVAELGDDDTAKLTLLGRIGSDVFAIDTTSSMIQEVPRLRTDVRTIADNNQRNELTKPSDYVLVTFGDMDAREEITSELRDDLFGAVDRIQPTGGGDCKEAWFAGALQGIKSGLNKSSVYTFTDAEPKDDQLEGDVVALAKAKDTRIYPMLSGNCSCAPERQLDGVVIEGCTLGLAESGSIPINPAFVRVAEATGGQVFPAGSDVLAALLAPALRDDYVVLKRVQGRLPAFNGMRRIPINVDATVDTLHVSAMLASRRDIVLLNPNQAAVANGSDGATIRPMFFGTAFSIADPMPGTWTLELRGTGDFRVDARANSSVQFDSLEFVRASTDVHGGYFPIAGEPISGATPFVEAILLGPVSSARFELVNEAGDLLSEVSLQRNFVNAPRGRYLGAIAVPSVPFRVAVAGTTAAGASFRREYPVLYRPRTVALELRTSPIVEAAVGATASFEYQVRNTGSAEVTLAASATDDLGFGARVAPARLTLAAGASQTVRVTATVSRSAKVGSTGMVALALRHVPAQGQPVDEAKGNDGTTSIEVSAN